MRIMRKVLLLCLGLSVGFQWQATGSVIAGWDVAGVDVASGTGISEDETPYTFHAGTISEHISVAHLQLGSGVEPSTAASQYGFKINDSRGALPDAIAANHYLQVTIAVQEGYLLNLDRVEMRGNSTGTGCDDVAWMSSIAGFTAGNEIIALSGRQGAGTGGLDTTASGFGGPIDLSMGEYQDLSGEVIFRLYGWNSSSSAGVTRIRDLSGDDLSFHGNVVPIPEPSSAVLVGMMAAIWLIRKRRNVLSS